MIYLVIWPRDLAKHNRLQISPNVTLAEAVFALRAMVVAFNPDSEAAGNPINEEVQAHALQIAWKILDKYTKEFEKDVRELAKLQKRERE